MSLPPRLAAHLRWSSSQANRAVSTADPLGNIFIAGYGDNKVHEVKVADGKMYLIAGTGSAPANTTDPAGDGGLAASALLKQPRSIATDAAGNIYIADTGDNRIREVLTQPPASRALATSRPLPAPV